MGITVKGVESLVVRLNQTGERALRGVSAKIREGAKKIQYRAVEYAPVDEGDLESAIKVMTDRGGINSRLQATVYVDGDEEASNGKKVGDYALAVHEGVAPFGSGGWGRLGKRSKIKDGNRGVVGGKFLERAAEELAPEITKDLQEAIRKALS